MKKMKCCVVILFLCLCIVNGNPPEEDHESKTKGEDFVNKNVDDFINAVQKQASIKVFFRSFYYSYLKEIQKNNNLLMNQNENVIENINDLLETINDNPNNKLDTTDLKQSIKEFTENSYKNFYLIGHAIKWINLRYKSYEEYDSKQKMFETGVDLEAAKNLIEVTTVYFNDKLKAIDFFVNASRLQGTNVKKINTKYIKSVLENFKNNIDYNVKQELAFYSPRYYRTKTDRAARKMLALIKTSKGYL